MDKHLLSEMIHELQEYRSSMHLAELFGPDVGKLDHQKNLERIINQAKQQLACM